MDIENEIRTKIQKYNVDILKEKFSQDGWIQNQAINTYEFLTKSKYLSSLPTDIFLPITKKCNSNCVFCVYCENYNYFMPIDDIPVFKEFLKYVVSFGLNCYGEPLLHPELVQFAKEVKRYIDKRASIYLVTNGILLDKLFDSILKHCSSINISLNAASPDTYKLITRTNRNNFYKILDIIKELSSNKKIQVYISLVVTSINFHEIPKFIELCNYLNVDRINLNTLGLVTIKDLTKSKKTSVDLYRKLYPTKDSDFKKHKDDILSAIKNSQIEVNCSPYSWDYPSIYEDLILYLNQKSINEFIESSTCSYLYKRMLIDRDSKGFYKRICCYIDELSQKNYLRHSKDNIFKLLNDKDVLALRTGFGVGNKDKLFSICKACSFFNINIWKDK